MLLNMLRVEEIDIEFLVKMSLKQHQNEIRRPGLESELSKMVLQRDAIEVKMESIVGTYFSIKQRYDHHCKTISKITSHPKYCVPFLQPGRLIYLHHKDANISDGWAVITNHRVIQTSKINSAQDERERHILKVIHRLQTVESLEPDDEKQKERTASSKKTVKLLEVDLTNVLYTHPRVYVGKNYKKEQAR